MTVGEMMANEHSRKVAMACAREVSEIAQAKGLLAPDFDVEEHVTSFNEKVAGAKPSMLQDQGPGLDITYFQNLEVKAARGSAWIRPFKTYTNFEAASLPSGRSLDFSWFFNF